MGAKEEISLLGLLLKDRHIVHCFEAHLWLISDYLCSIAIVLINPCPCRRGEGCCKFGREDIGTSQAGALERSRAPSLSSRTPVLLPLPAMWGRCSPPPLLLLLLPLPSALGQFEEEEKPYRGQLVGSLNSYHHQVSEYPPPRPSCPTTQLQTLLLNILS